MRDLLSRRATGGERGNTKPTLFLSRLHLLLLLPNDLYAQPAVNGVTTYLLIDYNTTTEYLPLIDWAILRSSPVPTSTHLAVTYTESRLF